MKMIKQFLMTKCQDAICFKGPILDINLVKILITDKI